MEAKSLFLFFVFVVVVLLWLACGGDHPTLGTRLYSPYVMRIRVRGRDVPCLSLVRGFSRAVILMIHTRVQAISIVGSHGRSMNKPESSSSIGLGLRLMYKLLLLLLLLLMRMLV